MGKFTALAQAYLNYVEDKNQFNDMPLWKRELAAYNSRKPKPVTLPPSDADTAHKVLEDILVKYKL